MQLQFQSFYYSLIFTSCILYSCSREKQYLTIAPPKGTFIIHNSDSTRHYQLFRNGKPYFIKGACGVDNLMKLKLNGGNSIRTYNIKNADQLFSDTKKLGLTVTLGIWLEDYYHFDYSDTILTNRKLQEIKSKK